MNRFGLLLLLVLQFSVIADVKTSSGNINFDLGGDGSIEMKLTARGLGVGTANPSANMHVTGNAIFASNLYVGTTGGNSTLQIGGSMGISYQAISSNTTLGTNMLYLVDTSSANIKITLPYAGNVTGRQYTIKKIATANRVWVTGGGNYIHDMTMVEMASFNSILNPCMTVISQSGYWRILERTAGIGVYGYGDLVYQYKFDEKGGVYAYDSSMNGYRASLDYANAGGFGFANSGNAGLNNGCLAFDGSDDELSVDNAPEIVDNFTFGAWIRSDSTVPADAEATSGTPGLTGDRFAFWPSNKSASSGVGLSIGTDRIKVYEHGTNIICPTSVYVTALGSTWHQVYVVCVNGTCTIYLDGVSVHTGSDTGRTTYSPYYIGGFPGGYGWHDGEMDDVRCYNRAFSATEIGYLYNPQ